MFFRIKKSGPRAYVQIVKSRHVAGRARQSAVANLGRADELAASGALASLLASGAKLCDDLLLIPTISEGDDGEMSLTVKRIGGPMLFGRIWQQLGIDAILADLLKKRAFGFAVEQAVFILALHRLFVSTSDRDCATWMADYDISGAEGLEPSHFLRATAWLGEEIEEEREEAPRYVKDLIEERLFKHRRAPDLSTVYMLTVKLRIRSEDSRPLSGRSNSAGLRYDPNQMTLGLVVDGEGWPIGCEMWQSDLVSLTTLRPAIERLRSRFPIGRVCVVAEGGMIATDAVARLEEHKLEYILGVRERSDAVVRKVASANGEHFVQLFVKGQPAVEIDASLLAEEARFDAVSALRTNANATRLQVLLRYRDLLRAEKLVERATAAMRVRSKFPASDAVIRGAVFCSFLALTMQRRLDDLLREANVAPEWSTLSRDLDRLAQARIRHRSADWLVRSDASPTVSALLRCAGVALPPRAHQACPPPASPKHVASVVAARGERRAKLISPKHGPNQPRLNRRGSNQVKPHEANVQTGAASLGAASGYEVAPAFTKD